MLTSATVSSAPAAAQEYFTNVTTDHTSEAPHIKTVTVFKDPNAIKRSASYVSWHPDGSLPKVVVSYSILQFQQQPAGMPLSSYVWDVNNPNTPEYEMLPTSQVCCAKFNVKDQNAIGAGLYNGQVAFFDMRKGSAPVETSPIDVSHRDPVYDMAWLAGKTGNDGERGPAEEAGGESGTAAAAAGCAHGSCSCVMPMSCSCSCHAHVMPRRPGPCGAALACSCTPHRRASRAPAPLLPPLPSPPLAQS
jgi:hypothetical protein